ncbi:transposase family protein [Candidatus Endoriftia persephonae]|uniref:transposase family protein n=1 Tax=Candidatus Endoriftia persephonae TaxID=393765 RepID=UPI000A05552E
MLQAWKPLHLPVLRGEGQAAHATKPRMWCHLNFFQHEAYIHVDLPRVRCKQCGKTTQVALRQDLLRAV